MKIINSNTEDAQKGWGHIQAKQRQGMLSACYTTDKQALREATGSKGVIIHSSRFCQVQVHWRQGYICKDRCFHMTRSFPNPGSTALGV